MSDWDIDTGTAGALALGGLAAMALMRNKNAISALLNKGATGKATRKAAVMTNVGQPVGKIATTVTSPAHYDMGFHAANVKTALKHPIRTLKNLKDGNPNYMDPKLQPEYIKNLRNATRGAITNSDDDLLDWVNIRNPLFRENFWLPTSPVLKSMDDVYIRNASGSLSLNRANKLGNRVYKQIAENATTSGARPPKNALLGSYDNNLIWNDKRYYQDLWDFGLNKGEGQQTKELFKGLWDTIKQKSPDKSSFLNTYIMQDPITHTGMTRNDVIKKISSNSLRKVIDKITDPVIIRGEIKNVRPDLARKPDRWL
jgi:hypothetical protein